MSWLSELAGKAESLLNNLDEQTGVALRNHNAVKKKNHEYSGSAQVEPTLGPKKRILQRNLRKPLTSYNKDVSSTSYQGRVLKDVQDSKTVKPRKSVSPLPKTNQHNRTELNQQAVKRYTLNHPPQTLVVDVSDTELDESIVKHRRSSLPSDLKLIKNEEEWLYTMQNLEIENVMLKNELNVTNKEFMELLYRLRKTEDGNDVDYEEFKSVNEKLVSNTINTDNLLSENEELKQNLINVIEKKVMTYRDKNKSLKDEVDTLRNVNQELEEKCKELEVKSNEREISHGKLENELRHAQSTVADLQSNLKKATEECKRLEKDWESYKLRVKKMLNAKDEQIKTLQEGMDFSEETKDLIAKIDTLSDERDELSNAVQDVRAQCEEMHVNLQKMETQNTAAERVVAALREALRDERAARNKADAQYHVVVKELKNLQLESGQMIATLRTALQDKDEQLNRLRESTSTVRSPDTSALNVADYDVMQDTIENNKIQYLTQTLVQRQAKVDKLLAQNNTLKIQLEKLESKYKSELAAARASNPQSVVHVPERARACSGGVLAALSVRGVMVKRYPIFRLFIIFYMVCLHFWVLTVLFTSTPEDYIVRPSRS